MPLRRQYVALVEGAKAAGATTQIFSSMHVSGNQLSKLGGIAALLRFPLPIDDMVAAVTAAEGVEAAAGDTSDDSDDGREPLAPSSLPPFEPDRAISGRGPPKPPPPAAVGGGGMAK